MADPQRVEVVVKGVDIGIMELATLLFRMTLAWIPAALALLVVFIVPYLIIMAMIR